MTNNAPSLAGEAPDWRALLDRAIVDLGSARAVAVKLGVAPCYISRAKNPAAKSGLEAVSPR
ncbi:MAG: hypothetical protein LBS89_06610, partial [Zoogloeaceae bacterium]|nr:hypothetical protein [Zoogloeaceae bacterium]